MIGWIKLYRALKDWQWYDDHNATRLLIHLLISVNYEDKKWRGVTVQAGSIIYSWDSLSKSVKLSVKQCRTAMMKLENSGEVTRIATNRFQLVTLVKWEEFQSKEDYEASGAAGGGQSKGNQRATTKEDKEYLERRITEFKNSLQPFLEKYGGNTLNNFFMYWTEKKPKGRKMRFEMERVFDISRRLITWKKREKPEEKGATINRQTKDVIEKNASNWNLPDNK